MPFPVLLVIGWLVEAAVAAVTVYARQIIVAGALAFAWEMIRDRLLKIAHDYMPDVMIWAIRHTTGLELSYPLTGESLTRAVNARIGQNIFSNLTNPKNVRHDVAAYACLKVNAALPSLGLLPSDFLRTPASNARLIKKLAKFARNDVKLALISGAGQAITSAQYLSITSAIVARYPWVRPPPVLDTEASAINRRSARWWARHHTLVWV